MIPQGLDSDEVTILERYLVVVVTPFIRVWPVKAEGYVALAGFVSTGEFGVLGAGGLGVGGVGVGGVGVVSLLREQDINERKQLVKKIKPYFIL